MMMVVNSRVTRDVTNPIDTECLPPQTKDLVQMGSR
jgi:hypothetical protein